MFGAAFKEGRTGEGGRGILVNIVLLSLSLSLSSVQIEKEEIDND